MSLSPFFRYSGWTQLITRRCIIANSANNMHSSSSSDDPQIPTLTFTDVQKEMKEKKSLLIIDVREKGELTEDGRIPGSRHIPLGEVGAAFDLDPSTFKTKYGFDKPEEGTEAVVHCKAGVRAFKAAVAMRQRGFGNVRVYSGIMDWISNGGQLVK